MKNKSKIILLIGLLIMLTGCRFENEVTVRDISTDLESWCGEYRFSESSAQPDILMIMDYKMEIYEEEGDYYADIAMDGQTTLARAKAKVYGDEEWISLTFLEYLPDNIIGISSEKNDVLISFRRENEEIYTYWGDIKPMFYENEKSGKVYFTKEIDHIPEELQVWIGEYVFSEKSNSTDYPFEKLDYKLRIYKENNQFFAEVQVDEEQPYIREKAEVRGNKDEIRLLFLETLPGHVCELVNEEREDLLRLRKEDGEIYTIWSGIQPMLYENIESGEVYFRKVE